MGPAWLGKSVANSFKSSCDKYFISDRAPHWIYYGVVFSSVLGELMRDAFHSTAISVMNLLYQGQANWQSREQTVKGLGPSGSPILSDC